MTSIMKSQMFFLICYCKHFKVGHQSSSYVSLSSFLLIFTLIACNCHVIQDGGYTPRCVHVWCVHVWCVRVWCVRVWCVPMWCARVWCVPV